jgi:hypothetical protein
LDQVTSQHHPNSGRTKKSTYSRRSQMVSTVKKSTASMLRACARPKSRQESPPIGAASAFRSRK